MSEPTGTDHDDHTDEADRLREGALLEELASRHLAYRRSIDRLMETMTHTTVTLQATATTPNDFHPPSFSSQYRGLREAEGLFVAAQQALAEYRRGYWPAEWTTTDNA